MKRLLRYFLIHLATLWLATQILPGLTFEGGFRTLALGAIGLMVINFAVLPLLRVMFLPLNLLTLGFFTWVVNVVGLYLLTTIIPQIKLTPFYFPGVNFAGFTIPETDLNVLQVAIIASLLIGFISQFLRWLEK